MLIGDLNVEPKVLQEVVGQILVDAEKAGVKVDLLNWTCLGGSTHSKGKELDFAVGNVNAAELLKINKSNLRGGSDHDGLGVKL